MEPMVRVVVVRLFPTPLVPTRAALEVLGTTEAESPGGPKREVAEVVVARLEVLATPNTVARVALDSGRVLAVRPHNTVVVEVVADFLGLELVEREAAARTVPPLPRTRAVAVGVVMEPGAQVEVPGS
jgi:FAD/FMN-containing dehydrogenase